jgi:geranylgeranyl diphosphate synthase type I
LENYSSEVGRGKPDIEEITASYRKVVVDAISRVFEGDSDFSSAAREATKGGKKLRPVLALMTCEAVCGTVKPAIPVAVAYELAHSASLVQDDMIDESDLRHDKIATHKKHGFVKAILASDILLFQMFEEISKCDTRAMTSRRISKLLFTLGNAAKLTAKGEFLEMQLAAKPEITEAEYLQVASLKTGALFAASAASGALAGGGTDRVVEKMHGFGLNLGIAFQMKDDLLDVMGSKDTIGKPVFKDLQNNACNIVLVHALSQADTYQKNTILSLLYRKYYARRDIERLLDTLDALGSARHASELAEKQLAAGRDQLKVLPRSEAKEKLIKLTYSLGSRGS